MKLTILGSGVCIPSVKRNAPGYILEVKGKNILMDCGSGTLLQLERCGKSFLDIDAVLLTHTHPDHIADLVPLIQALMVYERQKGKVRDLLVVGPSGFKKFFQSHLTSMMSMPENISLTVLEAHEPITFSDVIVSSRKVEHSENSVAYRIEHMGKSFVYSGDTGYDENLVDFAKETDLLLIECSLPASHSMKGHLNSTEAGTIAQKAEVWKVVLTHIYPITGVDETVRIKEAKEVFSGEVVLAEDLMVIDV